MKKILILYSRDIESYTKKMEFLITNQSKRELLAANAIEKSHTWEPDNTSGLYMSLFDKLILDWFLTELKNYGI